MLNRKLTGVLAWGGLALILAVPSADLLSAKMTSPGAAPQLAPVAAPDSVTTASIDGPRVVPVLKTLPTPVKGKPLPSYISDPEPETAATAPAAAPGESAVETAAVEPDPTPPQPMPAHMRPLPPLTAAPTETSPQVATVAQPATGPQPLILDEDEVLANDVAIIEPIQEPVRSDVPRPPALVGEDELKEWDSGSLADYLDRRGLLSDATYSEENVSDEQYDEDGFYLSDGPNQPRRNRRVREDDSFVVFPFNNR